jgi:hypothetical protein
VAADDPFCPRFGVIVYEGRDWLVMKREAEIFEQALALTTPGATEFNS